MNGRPSIWQQLNAILLLPFVVVVVIPTILYYFFNWQLFSVTTHIQIGFGFLFLVAGLWLFVKSLLLFIKIGRGTLAPWQPTQKLVVKGLYQYTRNPMILGVLSILLGEALIFNSLAILAWTLIFFVGNTIYFITTEEPNLEKKFGEEYNRYKKNVPRWFPRFKPWRPE